MSQDRALEEGVVDLPVRVSDELFGLDTVLESVTLAVDAIGPAAFAGVALPVGEQMQTRVFTHPHAPAIDQAQYDTGQGPGLESYRSGEVRLIESTLADGPWAAFREACRAYGINSTASFPLEVGGVRHGSLTFYAHDAHAFGAEAVEVARLGRASAAQAGVVLAAAHAYCSARRLSEQLESALAHRAAIEQAKGIIVASTGVDPDTAFALLVRQSQHENRKVRDIAIALVNSKIRRPRKIG